jgi:D-sedoheptulose 7-phosphate isomerase
VSILTDHAATLEAALNRLDELEEPLAAAAQTIATSLMAGGKVFAAGNGGSAAEAQHMTAEIIGRLHPDRERRALAAIALHADTSTLTAVGNDYGYDQIFSRQVEALGRPEDVLIVFSTSGRSQNLVNAVEAAKGLGLASVAIVGAAPAALHEKATHVLAVPSPSLPAVQECHLVLLHVLVELVENLLVEAKFLTIGS